jgi:hypothetical protein
MNLQFTKYFSLTISFAVIGFYFYQILQYVYNFPLYDDYETILRFLIEWEKTSSLSQKFSLLFQQHNEHRVFFLRLISLINFYFGGNINFKYLIIFGNLSLLIIWFLFYKTLLKLPSKQNYISLVAISFLLFHFASWDNSFWAMASLQNFWIHTWVFLFFYFYFSEFRFKTPLALTSLFFAVFTSGNGFLILIPLTFYLFIFKNRKEQIIYFSFSILLIFVYFFDYHSVPKLQTEPVNVIETLKFGFAFIGSLLYLPQIPYLSFAVGLFISLFYFYSFYKKQYLSEPFLFSIFTFLMVTVAVVALSRADRGVEAAIISRYRINSTLILIICLVLFSKLFDFSKNILFILLILFISILYNFINFKTYSKKLSQIKEDRITGAWLWKNDSIPTTYPIYERGVSILNQADSLKIYQIKSPEISDFNFQSYPVPSNLNQTEQIEWAVDSVKKVDDKYLIKGFAKLKNKNSPLKSIFIGNQNLMFSTYQTRRYDLARQFKNIDFQESGFMIFVNQNQLNSFNQLFVQSSNKTYSVPIKIPFSE